jgi:polyphosphate kinase
VLKEGLKPYLADNSQAWEMNGNGEYRIKPTRRARICAQELLLADMAVGAINVA